MLLYLDSHWWKKFWDKFDRFQKRKGWDDKFSMRTSGQVFVDRVFRNLPGTRLITLRSDRNSKTTFKSYIELVKIETYFLYGDTLQVFYRDYSKPEEGVQSYFLSKADSATHFQSILNPNQRELEAFDILDSLLVDRTGMFQKDFEFEKVDMSKFSDFPETTDLIERRKAITEDIVIKANSLYYAEVEASRIMAGNPDLLIYKKR